MKLITISKVGYNHPSQANWSYGVWKVDLIDSESHPYCMSYTTKENFGGDYRFTQALKDQAPELKVIETKGIPDCPKITGVSRMPILDSEGFIKIVVEWFNNPKN